MLALVPLIGDKVNGARRWLTLPGLGFQFQPSEFARWVTLIAVVTVLAGREQVSRRASAAPIGALALAAIPAGLIFIEPDTGSAVVLLGLVAILLFIAGTPLRIFAIPGALLGAALAVAIQFRPYVADRILAFRDPWAHADDQGFQLVQSFVAFARGGLFGVGLGDGRQKLYYLPEAHTDFVLSVLAEELGLFGVAIVIGAFAALLIAGCRIALRSRDRFNFLMAAGMTALLTVPAVLNGAVVMGLVPPKGIAMPFLSYGRTSLLVSFVAVGTLLGIARREAKNRDANTPSRPDSGRRATVRPRPQQSIYRKKLEVLEPLNTKHTTSRFIVAGGGTGGHVTMALALGEEIARRGDDVLFVGSARGLEAKLVPQAGFELVQLPAQPLLGRPLLARLGGTLALARATAQAVALLRRQRTELVISVGGYASAPAAAAAVLTARAARARRAQRDPRAHQSRDGAIRGARLHGVRGRHAARSSRRSAAIASPRSAHRCAAACSTPSPTRRRVARLCRRCGFSSSADRKAPINSTKASIEALRYLDATRFEFFHQTGSADRERVAAGYAQRRLPRGCRRFRSEAACALSLGRSRRLSRGRAHRRGTRARRPALAARSVSARRRRSPARQRPRARRRRRGTGARSFRLRRQAARRRARFAPRAARHAGRDGRPLRTHSRDPMPPSQIIDACLRCWFPPPRKEKS